MTNMNAMLLADFYKIGHVFQYPPNTEYVYSNFTPRKSRMKGVNGMVFFGLQYFCKAYLIKYFNENFFNLPKEEALASYRRVIKNCLGDLPTYKHIEELHDLGYLPVKIKALPEGTVVPMRVPCFTIVNTDPKFYWVTNFVETVMSASIWQACTSATIAHEYRKLLESFAEKSGMDKEFVQWQAHDFAFRGFSSLESSILSGMGHLLSFTGTDTIPAICGLEEYYGASIEKELVGASVAASEHSVSCVGGKDNEIETFRRLIQDVYPNGIVSIVSDTWDLFKVCTEFMRELKPIIMARDGKLVIRPDSGDPADILCGNPNGKTEEERKGVVELLWDVFGGTVTDKGYKLLDSHIGAIYGDSITLERAKDINERLMAKGFAPQVVFGVGSFTYQYNTRDTFGTAIKATWAVVGGKEVNMFKQPITDDGTKFSAKGLLRVDYNEDGVPTLSDCVSKQDEEGGILEVVFENGKLVKEQSLAEIRARLAYEVKRAAGQ